MQGRKSTRASVPLLPRYRGSTGFEPVEGQCLDISVGGMFIASISPLETGTLLKFEVRIAEDQKLMHGVGRVVWRREVDRAEESYPAGMGIKFIKTGEGAAELINQLLAARQGAESSFDAGVREAVTTPAAVRPSAVPPAPTPLPPKPISASPTSSPALSVESGPRSLPTEAETAVTNPAKKRQDQAPEKRKVVLQGPALESPPSKPRPSPRPVASAAEASPQRSIRGSIAEETTARRTRPSVKKASDNPRWSGLVVILGLVGLVVFVVNRMRGPSAEEEPTAAPTVAAEPATPLPPTTPVPLPTPAEAAPAAEARPNDEVAPAVDPEQPPVQPASATEPPAQGSAEVAPAPATTSGAAAAPSAAPTPAPAPNGTSAPAASSVPPSAAPPSAVTPKAPAPPAAKPIPPKPAPAPAKPAAPKPSASVAPAAPPAPKPVEPAPAPPPPPPAATAGSGGDTSSHTQPAKKPPAASSEPAPTPPAAAPPAPPAPAPPPPAPPASDDNPY